MNEQVKVFVGFHLLDGKLKIIKPFVFSSSNSSFYNRNPNSSQSSTGIVRSSLHLADTDTSASEDVKALVDSRLCAPVPIYAPSRAISSTTEISLASISTTTAVKSF